MTHDATSEQNVVDCLDRLGFNSGECSVTRTQTFIKEAAAYLADEVDHALDPEALVNLSELMAILDFAAIGVWLKVTGKSNVGWTARIGSIQFSGAPSKVYQVERLQKNVTRFIEIHEETAFRVAEANY